MIAPVSRTLAVRSLSPTESWYAALGTCVGYTMEVRGPLDLDALATALECVRHAYPVLAARLEQVGDHRVLVAATGPLPGVSVVEADPSAPLTGYDVDPHDGLSAVHVVRDGDRATVALMIHHAIADGHHGVAVLEDFWSCYTDVVEGRSFRLDARGYPDAVEKILADRGVGDFEYPPPPAGPPTGRDAEVLDLPAFTNEIVGCELDTEALRQLCRREGVTLNALVSAAIIRAEAAERGQPITAIPYYITVDMRARLTPPVAAADGTNVISFVGFTATDDTDGDLVGLARAVGACLPEALDEGTGIRRTAAGIPGFLNDLARPSAPGSVLTTNLGTIPELRSPAGLALDAYRGVLHTKVQDASVLSPTSSGSMHLYVIYSFNGRTSVEIMLSDPALRESALRKLAALRSGLGDLLG
ncbi:phthiocerol/phthiodiolone dimycocerosyl transferase family protein [Saccharothrix sp. Mg75]|uniref:phthiocerol/phthiodiolone dimycocerosyl transferase family protein n=1 Tax=Saccharothrix sp. Mg75 TaxID=3445357 RepID=UPI003EE9DEE1